MAPSGSAQVASVSTVLSVRRPPHQSGFHRVRGREEAWAAPPPSCPATQPPACGPSPCLGSCSVPGVLQGTRGRHTLWLQADAAVCCRRSHCGSAGQEGVAEQWLAACVHSRRSALKESLLQPAEVGLRSGPQAAVPRLWSFGRAGRRPLTPSSLVPRLPCAGRRWRLVLCPFW